MFVNSSIWSSISCKKEDIKAALNTLIQIQFNGSNLKVAFVNFFKICEDLGVVVDQESRDQDMARNACADLLVEGKVGFTSAISERFSNFSVKIWDNGGVSVTGTHDTYSGGYFEWSGFHSYLETKEGYFKVGDLCITDGNVTIRKGREKKAKAKRDLPGGAKTARYHKVEKDGMTFLIDTNWSQGKVFLDKPAYRALVKKINEEKSGTPVTTTGSNPFNLSTPDSDDDDE